MEKGGLHYKLETHCNVWPTTFCIVFKFQADGRRLAGRLYMKRHSKAYPYWPAEDYPHSKQVALLELGTISQSGAFVHDKSAFTFASDGFAAKDVLIFHECHSKAMFVQKHWPKPSADGEERDSDEDDEASRHDIEVSHHKIVQRVRGRTLHESDKLIKLTNFYIKSVLEVRAFADPALREFTYAIILCRHRNKKAGTRDVYFDRDATALIAGTYDDVRYVDVEVALKMSELKSAADVFALFHRAHPFLLSFDFFPSMLSSAYEFAKARDNPQVIEIISMFGRQRDDLFYVSANLVFARGEMMHISESKFTIEDSYFADANVPTPPHEYPMFCFVPQPHVRFAVLFELVRDVLPNKFLNNQMPALAALAFAALGFQASKIRLGQGGAHTGVPVMALISTEPGTGKTDAARLASYVCGQSGRQLLSGDSTTPALMERLSQQRDMLVVVDDVVGKEGTDIKWSELARGIYDGTARLVFQRSRTPASPLLLTSNYSLCAHDAAARSRMIVITFDPLKAEQVERDDDLQARFAGAKELVSCIAPDLECLCDANGRLDTKSIKDCVVFVETIAQISRDRLCSNWGLLLYFMLMVNRLAGSTEEKQTAVLEWVRENVARAVYSFRRASSTIDIFIKALDEHRADISGNANALDAMDKTIFFHVLRNDAAHVYIRLDPVVKALAARGARRFKVVDIRASARSSDSCWVAQYRFYDTARCGWPIQKEVHVNSRGESLDYVQKVPREESELEEGELGEPVECLVVLKKYYKAVIDSHLESSISSVGIDEVSVYGDRGESIPFAKAVREDTWRGYEILKRHPFAPFNGVVDIIESVDDRDELLSIDAIAGHYNYEKPLFADLPPLYTQLSLYTFCHYSAQYHAKKLSDQCGDDIYEENLEQSSADEEHDDDEQSVTGAPPHADSEAPSSNPVGASIDSQEPGGAGGAPSKRRRDARLPHETQARA